MILDKNGFDLWSDGYDQDVELSDTNNRYPFAGYKELLNYIYKIIRNKEKASILDVGIGTGILTFKLYKQNYEITGIDFSTKMIEKTKKKMPQATLINWDFSKGIPTEIKNKKFDFVISTYALHHLDDVDKIKFIDTASSILKSDGKIIIGDVSFETRNDLDACKEDCGKYWDESEFYFVADEIIHALNKRYKCEYVKISYCAGVLIIST